MLSRCRMRLRSPAVLKRVEDGLGCSVKDSFVVLDLEPLGSHVLFEATWVRRAAAGAGSASTLDWLGVQTPAESSNSGPRVMDSMSFLPALLDSNDLRSDGTGSADGAGFALNRSGGVVGVSNVFPGSADLVI